ncbi:nucleoside hydrolase [Paramicrobacterium agarici]|uniref:nucleoside hydrolase n=1 Tax=Paramicrobacterium agarici TaxID=630514 RepID=UPI00116F0D42|nr:nucleoside hydrolase [Microbacterium agarici]TQO23519.1 pyrimidine-specific ribonucleoside hydrolase [Microbacterium agarici]
MPISVIADVDTGVDDALALLFLAAHPDIDLRAVTCVAGNASLSQVTQNTLDVLAAAGSEAPVAAGADRPLIEQARDAGSYHGANGVGNLLLHASQRTAEPVHAVELLRREIEASAHPVTLLSLAPMTNIALFLRLYPKVAAQLERIVVMGGTAGIGNASAVAEFNVWHDPEAAQIVLSSDVQTTLYPLDVFNRVVASEGQIRELRDAACRRTRLAAELLDYQLTLADLPADIASGAKLGDAGAAVFLVAPELFGVETWPVDVELSHGFCRGQTVVDRRLRGGEAEEHDLMTPTVRSDVALTVDGDAAASVFVSTLLGTAGDR